MSLRELGEFGFIERIRRQIQPAGAVQIGIGDDCAAVTVPPHELLLTSTDMLIESVHFRRDWTSLADLGEKSVAVNVSDVAAMGGLPRHLYLSLGVPDNLTVEDLDQFIEGFLRAAACYSVTLVGGDTCRSPGLLLISVTVEGTVPAAEMVRRQGARPGDAIFVSGTLGDSALGLQFLLQGTPLSEHLAARHHRPQARSRLGRRLSSARLPSAMIDVSDGLLADLGHILESSLTGALIDAAVLPLSTDFRTALNENPARLELALTGGEDYELLFCVPESACAAVAGLAEAGLPLTRIGTILPVDQGLQVRQPDGTIQLRQAKGFNHFQSNSNKD